MKHKGLRTRLARSGQDDTPAGVDSDEFYRLMDAEMAPTCTALGFARERSSMSAWMLRLPGHTLSYVIEKGAKRPYLPGLGGRFGVSCALVADEDAHGQGDLSSISYMEYFSDADLQEMKSLRDQVLTKILAQRLSAPLEQGALAAFEPLLRMEIGEPINRHAVLDLPYLDGDDVTSWGKFIASRLENTVKGIIQRPIYLMRPQTGTS